MRADRLTRLLGLALAALLTLAASGVPGAVHHLAEHTHASPTLAHHHDHAEHHACHYHGSQDDPQTPSDDSDHENGECKLCLMLAQSGKWGGWSASDPVLIEAPCADAVLQHTSVILTREPGAQRSRGPPTPAC